MKTTPVHQRLETQIETDTQEHVYKWGISRRPENASDWNVNSSQHSFTDQSIDQWRDCFNACLKAKSIHCEHMLWCVSLWYVTVMTFKAYVTAAVMNKLTYFSFRKVGWKQPSGEVGNFVAVLPKIIKVFNKVISKVKKGCNFFASQCIRLTKWTGRWFQR